MFFGARFWGPRYFGTRYWGTGEAEGDGEAPVVVSASLAGMLAWPARESIGIVLLEPSHTLSGFEGVGSPAVMYSIACPAFEPFHNGWPGGVYRPVIGVRENATDLTARASAALVSANAGSYFWDEAAEVLYVHSSSGASPDSFSAYQVFVRFHLATTGVVLDVDDESDQGIYYWPWLTGSAPQSNEALGSDLFGIKSTAGGDLEATNGHGFWLRVLAPDSQWNWSGKKVRVLLGGRYRGLSLAYGDYETMATMLVEDVACDETSARWSLKPIVRATEQQIPKTPIFESEYPNIDPDIEDVRGKHIPIGYGRCRSLVPLLVDPLDSEGLYLIADPAYQTLSQVHSVTAVSRTDGAKTPLTLTTHYTVDLIGCSITIVHATYAAVDYTFLVDVTGKPDGASPASPITTFAGIVRDLLQTFCGVRDADLDTASFTQADIDAPEVLSMWLTDQRTIASLISSSDPGQPSLEKSVLGLVRQSRTGLWQVKVRSAIPEAGSVSFTTADFVRFSPEPRLEALFWQANVYYGRFPSTDTWQVSQASDPGVRFLQETEEQVDIYTFLTDSGEAAVLAQRYLFIAGGVRPYIPFTERGAKLYGALVGDVATVTYAPASTASGMYDGETLELVELQKRIAPLVEISGAFRGLRGLGTRGWQWAADSASDDWATADDTEKQVNGFWAGEDGRIDPGDPDTADIKAWA